MEPQSVGWCSSAGAVESASFFHFQFTKRMMEVKVKVGG